MTIHEYIKIHDNTYMALKSMIHDIHTTWKFNTWRMSDIDAHRIWSWRVCIADPGVHIPPPLPCILAEILSAISLQFNFVTRCFAQKGQNILEATMPRLRDWNRNLMHWPSRQLLHEDVGALVAAWGADVLVLPTIVCLLTRGDVGEVEVVATFGPRFGPWTFEHEEAWVARTRSCTNCSHCIVNPYRGNVYSPGISRREDGRTIPSSKRMPSPIINSQIGDSWIFVSVILSTSVTQLPSVTSNLNSVLLRLSIDI